MAMSPGKPERIASYVARRHLHVSYECCVTLALGTSPKNITNMTPNGVVMPSSSDAKCTAQRRVPITAISLKTWKITRQTGRNPNCHGSPRDAREDCNLMCHLVELRFLDHLQIIRMPTKPSACEHGMGDEEKQTKDRFRKRTTPGTGTDPTLHIC